MDEKYNESYERKIKLLTDGNLNAKKYKVLDHKARIIMRRNFPELIEKGQSDNQQCLILTASDGT